MEKTNKRIITIAIILSLITAILIYLYLSANKNTVVPEIEHVIVYVAAKDIPARTEIKSSDLKQVSIAKELSNENAVTDAKEITGKCTLQNIIEGELIRKERLADKESMYVSYMVPEGTRAVSMDVTEQINVANLLRPGDFIDVVASFESEEEDNGAITYYYPRITETILQNVQVLALGQDVVLSAGKLAEPPLTVTLAIKEEEVEKFVYASEYGIIRLALRPVTDTSVSNTNGVTRSDVTGTKGVYSKANEVTE